MKPKLTYVTLDSLSEGVGASQVREYVLLMSKRFDITLISFEKDFANVGTDTSLTDAGVIWKPQDFGNFGLFGGLRRAFRLLKIVPRHEVIHARSDFCASLAILKGNRRVIWDCRALMSDHRRSIHKSGLITFEVAIFRLLEYICAKGSLEIIIITNAVKPVLTRRYNLSAEKFTVIPTCVNLEKFQLSPMPSDSVCSILIAGTLSAGYDFELMNLIIHNISNKVETTVTVALGQGHDDAWRQLNKVDSVVSLPHFAMPDLIARHKVGLAIWKNSLGVCLTSVAATKFAEFLAVGRPVIVNFNQGDIGKIVESNNIGVSTKEIDSESINFYTDRILSLLEEPDLTARCRMVAERDFNLNSASDILAAIYFRVHSFQ